MSKGNLFVISAPSGTGKSSLLRAILVRKVISNIKISISHTTRLMRSREIEGKHYHFVSKENFEKMIKENKFLEYAEVFSNYYGTSKSFIFSSLSSGIDVFLDIDWKGAKQVRYRFPSSKSIFVLPPSKKELYRRLCYRNQDSKKVISQRMKKAVEEMNHYSEYDYLVINDDFNIAMKEIISIIYAERLKMQNQKNKYKGLITNLLNGK